MRNLFNRDPRLLNTLNALAAQMGPAGLPEYSGNPVDQAPVFTTPLTPRGGIPPQQIGGAGGFRTAPPTVSPPVASPLVAGPGGPPGNKLRMFQDLLLNYRRRRFGQPTTGPVGPAMPQNPTTATPRSSYYP